jgi:protein required for attachment to host cells
MNAIQIAVADRGSARIYECAEGGTRLRLLAEVTNPGLGRHERDLVEPRAGRVYNRTAGRPQALADRVSPREQEAARFARTLARRVGGRMTDRGHDALILVAEPRFLGRIRGGLSKAASRRLAAVVPHDCVHETTAKLERRLAPVIRKARAAAADGGGP